MALSLGLDVFAGGLALGIRQLPREVWAKTALIFACLGMLFLSAGLLVGLLLSDALGIVASYVAGSVLLVLGLRAIYHTLRNHHDDDPALVKFTLRSVIISGSAVSIDKLAVGVSLAVIDIAVGPALAYLAVQGFVATLLGLILGRRLGSGLGGFAHVLAGGVFVVLGEIILVQTLRNRDVP